MNKTNILLRILALVLLPSIAFKSVASDKRGFLVDDLVTLERISSAGISPNDENVVYVVRTTDMKENRGRTDLWLSNIDSKRSIQLTTHQASDYSPVWSKDGKSIYFLSSRSGSAQLWSIRISDKKLTQVTDFPVSVSSFKLSGDNKMLLFSASVYPECDDFECTVSKDKLANQKKTTGVVYDKMFVRHWDHWIDEKQSQLFLMELNGNKNKIVPISKAVNANVPSDPFGGDEEYEISEDGSTVYFAARIQNAIEPTSTNFDIYRVKVDAPYNAVNLTESNKAWDTNPVISNDGSKLAYLAMSRPGFEADKFDLVIRDLRSGKSSIVTKDWDRSFGSINFSKDDQSVYLKGNHLGTKALWKFDLKSKQKTLVNKDGAIVGLSVGTNKIIFAKDSLRSPVQLFSANIDGTNQRQITNNNLDRLKQIQFGDYEQFKFKGWNNETVHGYVVKPWNFEEGKKYPLAFLIHGGPQGSFGDHFHYRWNPQTYAGQGYVSVMIDFHGSTGYGQDFTDSITQNWGSKPFEDLQKGLDFALKKYDFIDAKNVCALGASYGGYMINWIAGNWPDRFKCLVNHDGVFDNRMMYYATEELWFVEWENGGTYFDQKENHERYNPVNFVNNWKTPMLVVQGELDYRIPVTQSLATFTALQRKGIKSKLLYFPDENHWVLKPANSIQWHNEVNKWLKEFLN